MSENVPCGYRAGNGRRPAGGEESSEIVRETLVALEPRPPMRKAAATAARQETVICGPSNQLQVPQQSIIADLLCKGRMIENIPISICKTQKPCDQAHGMDVLVISFQLLLDHRNRYILKTCTVIIFSTPLSPASILR